ncbi:MAG: glycosyltransferase, partial [Myxococcota bacterium]
MRVVLVIDSLGSGGAQRQLVLVFNELLRQGVDVWLVYYQDHHHFRSAVPDAYRHRVLSLHEPAIGVADYARLLKANLRRLSPDVVVSFLRGPAMLVAGIRASGLNFHWIASERAGQLELTRLARVVGYLAALRLADRVAPNSAAMADTLVRVGIPRRRICVVPNGVTLDEAALSAPIARPVSPLRILVVGTRVPETNHVAVFEALGAQSARDDLVVRRTRSDAHAPRD